VSIRDALEVLALLALVLLCGQAAWTLAAHRRRFGSALAWARPYRRSVRVPVDWERARELCHRALLEALGTRTSRRDQRGEFTARIYHRRRSYMHVIRFRLRRDASGGTMICVESGSTGQLGNALPYPGGTAWRRGHVDALIDWLARTAQHENQTVAPRG
jgi:hypothetical protein